MECISKQAYYDVQHSTIKVISLDEKCDKVLTKAFNKIKTAPDDIKIEIINTPEDYEHILRSVCYHNYFTLYY